MPETSRQRVLVGVSRSAASQAALRWAAEEARLRGATLHVVWAWDSDRPVAPYASSRLPSRAEEQAAARQGLTAAMRAVFGDAAPAGVVVELAEGVPERVMVDRSARADLVVLGLSNPAWLVMPSAGPVIRACLEHAACAVVVVGAAGRAPAPGDRPLADAAV